MKQLALVTLIVIALFGVLVLPAGSQTPSDTLETSVTPEFISVTLSGGPIEYGSVPLSTADNDRSSRNGGPVSVENTGSLTVDLEIHGSNAVPAPADAATNSEWTLDCTPGSGVVGDNRFVHRFATSSDPNFDFSQGSALLCPDSEDAKMLASGVEPGHGPDFVLQISMPVSSTGYAERTSQVIVTAMPDSP